MPASIPAPTRTSRELKVIKVGNSMGVILPKELLAKLRVETGDTLDWIPDGEGFIVRRHDAGFAEQMAAAREVMKRRRNALRELAK